MKAGTKYETNKRKGNNIFPRTDNPKLKNKQRKPAVDCRSGKRVLVSGTKNQSDERKVKVDILFFISKTLRNVSIKH